MPIVEISNGELADKWTIIEIKESLLTSPDQLQNLSIEASWLKPMVMELIQNFHILPLIVELKETNLLIWHLMEQLYGMPPQVTSTYVTLTNDITVQNQRRAFLKKEIDKLSHSAFSEAKSFFENPILVIDANKKHE